MDQKSLENDLKKHFSRTGWMLLVYYGIMNAAVTLVLTVDVVLQLIPVMMAAPNAMWAEELGRILEASVMSNGWGYILANAVGISVLLLWRKKELAPGEIWRTENRMKPGSFLALLTVMISAQAAFQTGATLWEWLFNRAGLSILETVEQATLDTDSFSMFLYAGIVAPIGEEILFRGLILRSLQPYGKRFAILTSAFLFGLFHGNFLQTPYAILVGLLLGYVTVEYSVGWAMVFHMFNNLVLADLIGRICRFFPPFVEELTMLVLIWGCAIAAVAILGANWKKVWAYFAGPKIHPMCLKCFAASPGILVFTGLMIANIALGLLMSFL